MRYWEEMRGKFGFGDGEQVPDGAAAYRAVYVATVNRLAEQLGSGLRAVAWDRPGLHNWCLIVFRRLEDLAGVDPARLAAGDAPAGPVAAPDAALEEAIAQADAARVDEFVAVTVAIDPDFRAFLADLAPDAPPDPDDDPGFDALLNGCAKDGDAEGYAALRRGAGLPVEEEA